MGKTDLHERASALFLEACGLEAGERTAFLDRHCAEEPALRQEVEELLAFDPDEDSNSPTTVSSQLAALADAVERHEMPETIGRYRIVRVLGEGGMGTVYEAEQEHPRRRVALKVIRAGLGSRRMQHRFRQEAELLGRLQHPGIAQIYDAGTAETALGKQPYVAMEYVDGLPLHLFAQRAGLETRQRLELLQTVCEAVQHAHQRGVIHRDLKPANILVTPQGEAKVLDFGVARAMDGDQPQGTLHTAIDQIVGTLSYMSPEQIAGERDAIDTRSDVYALGVVGFQLLSGQLPHDLRDKPLPEASRLVSEHDAPRLGTLQPRFRGDIETLIATALDKDRERRYASAAQLAGDIRRFLQDQPLLAQPPGAVYQFRKFARRNRALVGGAIVALAGLIAGTGFATWQAVSATHERNRAIAAERRAVAVNDFLHEVIGSVAPEEDGREVRVVDVLADAGTQADRAFAADPATAAALHAALGRSYQGLGLWPEAVASFETAIERFEASPDVLPEATLRVRHDLVRTLLSRGDLNAAAEKSDGLLQRCVNALGERDALTLDVTTTIALLNSAHGDADRVERLLRNNLSVQRNLMGEDHASVLRTEDALAEVLQRLRRQREAEDLTRAVLARRERILGPQHPDTLATLRRLRMLVSRPNSGADAAERDELTARLMDEQIEVLGEDHPMTLLSALNSVMRGSNRNDPRVLESQIRLLLEQVRPEDRVTAQHARLLQALAKVLDRQGRWDELLTVQREVLEIHTALYPANAPQVLHARHELGRALLQSRRIEEAEPVLRSVMLGWRELGDDDPHTTLAVGCDLGQALFRQRKWAEAEEVLAAAIEYAARELQPATHFLIGPQLELAVCQARQGKLLEAQASFQRMREFDDGRMRQKPWMMRLALAEYLLLTGKLDEAEPILIEALRIPPPPPGSNNGPMSPGRPDREKTKELMQELDALRSE